MDRETLIAQLKTERAKVEEAIVNLERLALGRGKRRGRPPAWMIDVLPKRRGRPPGSKNKVPTLDSEPPLPPAASMGIPRRHDGLIWAVSGKKRPPL